MDDSSQKDIPASGAGPLNSADSVRPTAELAPTSTEAEFAKSGSETISSSSDSALPSNSTKACSTRKVGDVLFAERFPEKLLSMLTMIPIRDLSVGSVVSDVTSDSLGSAVTPTPLSGPQGISVNPKTGGRKRTKPLRYDLIPVEAMAEVALLYGLGARLYEPRNWELGYEWSLSYAALRRHLELFWLGHDWDEDGAHHLAAVVFHALALMQFSLKHPQLDDRSK